MFFFNPALDGFTDGDIFKTISGNPYISSGVLKLNAAEITSWQALKNPSIEFSLTIPAVPTVGDVRAWGIKNPNVSNDGRAEFDITDDEFSAKVYDRDGTEVDSKTIVWDSDWTASEARYAIIASDRYLVFKINGDIVAKFEDVHDITPDHDMNKMPMPLHIINENSDDLLVNYVNGSYSAITTHKVKVSTNNYSKYEATQFTITGADTNYDVATEETFFVYQAKKIDVYVDTACTVKINSASNDAINLAGGEQFTFESEQAFITNLFITTTSDTIVRIVASR